MDFLTILFIILNIPAMVAMVFLINRSTKLRVYERISWLVFSFIAPIITLVLFTVQVPNWRKGQSSFDLKS
ncbi:hypothetical protein [Nafulsella turpanensis]|uniref:hypothetical protein n=1 Tax=Nafulsella turpanensis TaxID=1265690 RepID=UPI000349D8D0|nr:hypothetical protein [Nafulsella turpanensis]